MRVFLVRQGLLKALSGKNKFPESISKMRKLEMKVHSIILLKLNFDDTFVKPYHLELYHKSIQELFMIKTSQRELIMMCIVIVDSMLKALTHTHTHTHHSVLVDLLPLVVDLYIV